MFPQELPEHDWGSKEGYLEDGQFASDRLLKKRKRMGVVHYLVEWRGAPARPQRARSPWRNPSPRDQLASLVSSTASRTPVPARATC